tara:strand:- start:8686 stop:9132 length:447 start_codon:yes stop_codon:yes gene_type:complete
MTFYTVNKEILQTSTNTNNVEYQIKLAYPLLYYIDKRTEFDYSNINAYTKLLSINSSKKTTGKLQVLYLPNIKILIEYSLKEYLAQYKTVETSRENLIYKIFTDIKKVISPNRLKVKLLLPDYSSELDSDWASLGGPDKYFNKSESWG